MAKIILLLIWALVAPICAHAQIFGDQPSKGVPFASLRGADFNNTGDQAINIPSSIVAYRITTIAVTNCSTSLTTAAGGFYPAASKGGTAIVAAGQAYTVLTSASAGLEVALTAAVSSGGSSYRMTAPTIYLSLTTAQGSAATCDIYVFGDDLT